MYYYVKGSLFDLQNDLAVIDCNGVGYAVSISKTTYNQISDIGVFNADGSVNNTTVLLYTHLNVREDAMELYGFFTLQEKTVFKLLTSISGIGPKAALAILSALDVNGFVSAVYSDNAKAIASAQGVGLKTAQKVILELKDKLEKLNLSFDEQIQALPQNEDVSDELQKEATDALIVLGYSKSEATKAIKQCKGKNAEELIRNALRLLMRT